jgi:hypothetical protein
MNATQYRLAHDDFIVGIVTLQQTESDALFGSIDLEEAIRKRVGWKGKRFADVFDALAGFLRVLDEEGKDSQSKEYRAAAERLEEGEISHYVFSEQWYAVDEARRARGVELLGYRDGGLLTWQWRDDADLPKSASRACPLFAAERDLFGYRLWIQERGRHLFGGPPRHGGVVPEGTDTPLHHFLTLDLADLRSPIYYDPAMIRYLPLYYPLAYGTGGAECQYAVNSDDDIRILFLSDPAPDGEDAYVREPTLPEARADIVPLTYEQLRMRAFGQHCCCVGFDADDDALREEVGGNHSIYFGGPIPVNAATCTCRNPTCQSFGAPIELDVVITIPPVPIHGQTDFWYEFEGEAVDFCFGLCPDCRTIIAFNARD